MYERESVCDVYAQVCAGAHDYVRVEARRKRLALPLFALFSRDSSLTDSGARLAVFKALQHLCLCPSQWWPRLAYMWVPGT